MGPVIFLGLGVRLGRSLSSLRGELDIERLHAKGLLAKPGPELTERAQPCKGQFPSPLPS